MHLHDLTIKNFHQGLLKKEFSALEITQAFFDWIEKRDWETGAYLSLSKDLAVRQAEAVDIKIAKNEPVGVIAGIPLAFKDNILIEGRPATAGSKILKDYTASYDATVIKKLKKAGTVFLGKTNCDEFAMGSSTENSAYKLTRNPHDLSRVPGGSSGGSAAAVAAHMAIAALGSDTGGSIRQPAAFCGVVGLKPTYGAVSRFGLIAMASSLDQIGPFTKTVEDAAILFKEIAGYDSMDSASSPLSNNYGDELVNPRLEDIRKLKIGVPEEYWVAGLDKEVAENVERATKDLQSLKAEVKKISLPHTKYALSCYYIIMPAEVSSNLERFDGIRYGTRQGAENLLELYKRNREAGFGAEPKRRILLGTFVLSSGYYDAYYAKAQRVRRLIRQDFDEAFKEVDVILTPVTPTPPFKFGEKVADPLAMYLSDIFTVPVNLAGLPAISIPVRQGSNVSGQISSNLPIGFQLIGKHLREADILGLGQYYEKLYL
ncbi:MAG: Asp-tRNA(Asn)/Glu-tRNA(Gln) amidotransferase subunit GatA [Candidatus Harrisonbacteria bacterium]|nr:Asp-tRNA(Asn)/Glu-tRNA(Gln) amidotransferase subunit GatA [Candidatus Harrisonbacteria bacterium]